MALPPHATAETNAPLTAAETLALGTDAYVYGSPVVNMYLKRQEHLKLAAVNHFRHIRDVISSDMEIVSPNVDVLYSLAWLDLRQGPIVLSVPASAGRYFSFQTVDFFTDNGLYASSRTAADKFHKFAFVGPNWYGKLPGGMQRLDCTTDAVGLIARTFVANARDLAHARAMQSQYKLEPLTPSPSAAAPQYPAFDLADPLNFFAILDEALRQNPPPPHEARAVEPFKKIGIGGATPFRVSALDETTRDALSRALEAGEQLVEVRAKQVTETAGGWALAPSNIGRYGTNFLLRAAAASIRLGINSPRECFYMSASVDEAGNPLRGEHRYVLRFEKDRLPPAEAFWSVTMYQLPERIIVSNALNRANLHSLDKRLRYGTDGSLEIYLQKDSPGPDKQSNWLPAPEGNFRVMLRLYEPPLSVIKREWTPPAVKRLP